MSTNVFAFRVNVLYHACQPPSPTHLTVTLIKLTLGEGGRENVSKKQRSCLHVLFKRTIPKNGRCTVAIVDMYQIVHNMTQDGEKFLNVYHAERANGAEQAQSVADSFVNTVWDKIRDQQVDSIINVDVVVFNLGTETDFHTQSLSSAAGMRAVADSPSFIAGGIRFPSLNRDIRSGSKRFAGMAESDYTDGVLVAAANTLLVDIATVMIGDWLASSDSHVVATYAIIKRVCDETDPVTGDCLKYRLPETDGELKFYLPIGSVVNQEITSQVSRKKF